MTSKTIDVTDLPEPIVRGLEVVAQMARTLSGQSPKGPTQRVELHPVKGGRVLTPLTREEIYAEDDEGAGSV